MNMPKTERKEKEFVPAREMVLASERANAAIARISNYSPQFVQLVKDTIARGATTEELKLFLYTAARLGLDPLAKQIHFTKRWNARLGKEVMVIIVGIDGFRSIAERSGKYAGQDDPVFTEKDGRLVKATATGYRRDSPNSERYPVAASAYWDEYCPEKDDFMWRKMPHGQLAKVAEALMLRKAFPVVLSGVYTDEEMAQAQSSAPYDYVPEEKEQPGEVGPLPFRSSWEPDVTDESRPKEKTQARMQPEEGGPLPFGSSVGADVEDAAPIGGLPVASGSVKEKPLVQEERWKLPVSTDKQVEEYMALMEDPVLRTLAWKLLHDFRTKRFDSLPDRDAEKILIALREASKMQRTKAAEQKPSPIRERIYAQENAAAPAATAQPKPAEPPAEKQKPSPSAPEQKISPIQKRALEQISRSEAQSGVLNEYLEGHGLTSVDDLTHAEAAELLRTMRMVKK